jgi:hypothetical protein
MMVDSANPADLYEETVGGRGGGGGKEAKVRTRCEAVDLRLIWWVGGRGYPARFLEVVLGFPLPFSRTSAGRKSLVRIGLTCAELGGRAGRCCLLAYF